MRTATVGSIQKNFAEVLKQIHSGEEVIVTRRGEPVAKITALGPAANLEWPDFYSEAIEVEGAPLSEVIMEERSERF